MMIEWLAFVRSLDIIPSACALSEFIKIINDLASSFDLNKQIAELIFTSMSFKATTINDDIIASIEAGCQWQTHVHTQTHTPQAINSNFIFIDRFFAAYIRSNTIYKYPLNYTFLHQFQWAVLKIWKFIFIVYCVKLVIRLNSMDLILVLQLFFKLT